MHINLNYVFRDFGSICKAAHSYEFKSNHSYEFILRGCKPFRNRRKTVGRHTNYIGCFFKITIELMKQNLVKIHQTSSMFKMIGKL